MPNSRSERQAWGRVGSPEWARGCFYCPYHKPRWMLSTLVFDQLSGLGPPLGQLYPHLPWSPVLGQKPEVSPSPSLLLEIHCKRQLGCRRKLQE